MLVYEAMALLKDAPAWAKLVFALPSEKLCNPPETEYWYFPIGAMDFDEVSTDNRIILDIEK